MNLSPNTQTAIDRSRIAGSPKWRRNLTLLCGAALLAACAGAPVAPEQKVYPRAPESKKPAAPSETRPLDSFAQLRLQEGIDQYDLGEFDGAILILSNSREIWAGPAQTKILAHKYLAFSYCVQDRTTLCRLHFDKALALNPQFDLQPAERGHPQWGPVFEKAKRHEGLSPKDILNNLTAPK